MKKPLEGVTILDFSQFFAGPIATLLMGDMGAEVIKLENPPLGDTTRYSTAIINESSTNFTTRNRGKKSVAMNLKDEKQKAIFIEMLKTADAVVENFKPGTLEKYGLSYEFMKSVNPRIVYTSISGYGQYGPYRDHAAYDGAVQAEAGILSITGNPGETPVKCGAAIADATAGLVGCIGTLGALFDAKQTGVGRRVDVSMMDSIITIMENINSAYMATGKIPTPTGNRMWTASPFNSFKCKDDQSIYLGISTDSQFAKFANIVGHPEWLEDERFVGDANRASHADDLEPLVSEALKNVDVDDLANKLQEAKLVYGKINNIAQVMDHPQTKARNMIVKATYPDGTELRVPGCPIKMSDLEEKTEFTASYMGGDTFEVLRKYGYSDEQLHEVYDETLKIAEETRKKKYNQ